ncbi:MAG TPA: STAS domain-containing protein [Candidatus Obscuribacterales bacterium]
MSLNGKSTIPEILQKYQDELLTDWLKEQSAAGIRRDGLMKETELRQQCTEFLSLLSNATRSSNLTNIQSPEWSDLRNLLASISHSRTRQGFTPAEIALFVFSFKQPLFNRLRREFAQDGEALADETLLATDLLDKLGLWTTEVYQKTREELIIRQQEEMLELSTPVVKLWEGILALPLIGTLDSARTQIVMESLLQKIVETGSEVAIIDITGVPTVDTLVAQHLLKTVAAARLMGTDCIISGIRPQIAQTIVHLGVDLSSVITKATLADAFVVALQRSGLIISRSQARS